MKTLLIAEHQQKLKASTKHALTAASQLGQEVDVLVVGDQCMPVAMEASKLTGVSRVLIAQDKQYQHQLAENVSALIADMGTAYDYIIAPATTFGKNILPRVAALMNVAMISDVMQVITPDTFVRPIYAGNVLATVQSMDKIKVLSIRTTSFAAVKEDTSAIAPIVELTKVYPNTLSTFESEVLTQSARPELTSARVIISGGRGLKSAENFKLLDTLADRLGAAIGASRAAVDAGFAPNDYQVGQTGKVVAPDLYIAVGISGAIQHLAGMKDSKVIVAINSDPEAPIFQVADYVLVGDLFKILPEFAAELDKVVS